MRGRFSSNNTIGEESDDQPGMAADEGVGVPVATCRATDADGAEEGEGRAREEFPAAFPAAVMLCVKSGFSCSKRAIICCSDV